MHLLSIIIYKLCFSINYNICATKEVATCLCVCVCSGSAGVEADVLKLLSLCKDHTLLLPLGSALLDEDVAKATLERLCHRREACGRPS